MGTRFSCPSCGAGASLVKNFGFCASAALMEPCPYSELLANSERERTTEMSSSYRRRGYRVEAKKFFTSPSREFLGWLPPHAIYTWVHNGDMAPRETIDIDGANRQAKPSDWIVKVDENSWQVLAGDQFDDMYEPVVDPAYVRD